MGLNSLPGGNIKKIHDICDHITDCVVEIDVQMYWASEGTSVEFIH